MIMCIKLFFDLLNIYRKEHKSITEVYKEVYFLCFLVITFHLLFGPSMFSVLVVIALELFLLILSLIVICHPFSGCYSFPQAP